MVALTTADYDILVAQLTEAETALHRLRIGRGVQKIGYGDKEVTYNITNIGGLLAYIDTLKAQLGLPTGRRRASRVIFG